MKTILLILIVLASAALVPAQTVDENSDIVGWSDVTFIVPLAKKVEAGKKVDLWTATFQGTLRMGRNLKRPVDERGTVTLNYRFNKNFTAGTGYMYRRYRLTEARPQFEHRLMFFLIAEKKWTKAAFKNRFLTTYLAKHGRPDTVVYRNRAQLSFPIVKDKKEVVTPFVADEPFYDFREKRWFRNDFFAGIAKQVTPKFGLDVFYVRQGFNLGALRQTNGFGISLRYRIDLIK